MSTFGAETLWYDSHVHLCNPAVWRDIEAYLAGFAGATALSLPWPGIGTLNAETLEIKRRSSGRVWALASFDHRAGAPPLVDQARAALSQGFDGFKLWCGKPWAQVQFGIAPDDPRFDGVYDLAAQAGTPVLIHFADPPEFWESGADGWLSFESYLDQAERVAKRHRGTSFVFAHLLFLAGDLRRLSHFLDSHPNVNVDLAPGKYMYGPLSRTRDESRNFFRRYADRILFGSDGFFFPPAIPADFRLSSAENLEGARFPRVFLEAGEPMTDPFTLRKGQEVRGLGLDAEVLDRVGRLNHLRVFGPSPTPIAKGEDS